MSSYVLLRLDAQLQPDSWLRVDGSRADAQAHSATQSPPPELPVIAITASPELAIKSVNAPQKALERFRGAVGFALEDVIAGDVDSLQFALPVQLKEGQQLAAMMDKTQLARAQAQCQAAGFTLRALLPEASLLACDSVLLEREYTSFHFSGGAAGSIESDQLGRILKLKHTSDGALPLQLFVVGSLQLSNMPAHIQISPISSALTFFAERLKSGAVLLNLLPAQQASGAMIQFSGAWKKASFALAAAVLSWLCIFAVQDIGLRRQARAQDQQVAQMYERLFPNQELALDPLARIQSKLKSEATRSATGSGLHMLRQIAPVLASETQLRLQNVNFRAGALDLTFRSPDLATLEQARARLGALVGISASMGSNTVDPDGRMLTAHVLIGARP
jgi:type II secretion system protein L